MPSFCEKENTGNKRLVSCNIYLFISKLTWVQDYGKHVSKTISLLRLCMVIDSVSSGINFLSVSSVGLIGNFISNEMAVSNENSKKNASN